VLGGARAATPGAPHQPERPAVGRQRCSTGEIPIYEVSLPAVVPGGDEEGEAEPIETSSHRGQVVL
jgi:hypothetical protein